MRIHPPSHRSPHPSSRLALVGAFQALLVLTLALAACTLGGPNTSTPPTPPTPPTFTPTFTPDPEADVRLNAPGADTVGGLRLALEGLTDGSPGQPYAHVGISCSPNLAFTAPDPTAAGYSARDVQAIRAFVSAVPVTRNTYPLPDSQPPSSLRWLAVGSTCGARLDVTNTGNTTETISAAGFQLVAGPTPNTYHYAQLDLCSISIRFQACGFNGSGPDEGYFAFITLGSGTAFEGAVETEDPTAPDTPLPLLLPPGQTKSISMRIVPDANQAAGAIYRIMPDLTVSDTATHVLTFDTLKQTLVFASASQISCYGLAGDVVVPSNQIDHGPDAHSWC